MINYKFPVEGILRTNCLFGLNQRWKLPLLYLFFFQLCLTS